MGIGRRVLIGGAVALALTVGLVGGLLIAERFLRPRPADLTDGLKWKLTKAFVGSLEPGQPVVSVRLLVFDHVDDDHDHVMQNRIEIDTERGTAQYMWPVAEYAAHWAEVLDLDNDGSKEFVLLHGSSAARVVTYRQGRFAFDERRDQVMSPGGPIELVDVDGDGSIEFVTFASSKTLEEQAVTRKTEYSPKLFRWSEAQRFHVAPESLVADYRRWRSSGR
jgi:hypothetical protein